MHLLSDCMRTAVRALRLIALALPAALAATAPAQPVDAQPARSYFTLHLSPLVQSDEARDIVNDLRNMLPNARIYLIGSQAAVSIHATPEDFAVAQKIVADLDRNHHTYRITYTLAEVSGSTPVGAPQRLSLVIASGSKSSLKQGTRVPIITGTSGEDAAKLTQQVQYLDVGLSIEASLEGDNLHTKVERTALAADKPATAIPDPTLQQTLLAGISTLHPGKPLIIGSLDIPGTTHQLQISVETEMLN